MEVRITYRSEIYIKGETIDEIRKNFESLDLDPDATQDESVTDFGFIEVTSVEDADTYDDLSHEFNS